MTRKTIVHPIGIDLGTTYSCLSVLNRQGQPQTLPNADGELSTPSVVFFDGQDVIVGTEALRNSITHPDHVVMHAKRHMGDPRKKWLINGEVYSPIEISAFILKKLLEGAEQHLGGEIRRAVITVPAQFSDIQRQWTVEAGKQAGLEHVDIINEPVAAALCHVLGEGMWFAELANDQTVLVFDLGGGTFDLSLVSYNQSEVRVKASGGDLNLGGLDWNLALEKFAAEQFEREVGIDPRLDRESMQSLALEVEQVKRALSVRPKASLVVQNAGRRKSYGISREQFEQLTEPLVKRLEEITRGMLKLHRLGWQDVDAILITGGSSRMPMVRNMLQRISGTTPNATLSPDQSISHGAAFYAGMLLSGQSLTTSPLNREASSKLASVKQQSVNARSLGILVRNMQSGERVPHYLIPPNSPLPVAYRQEFGTVTSNQSRVNLRIVESGASASDPFVEIGTCRIDGLPARLPVGSPIEVTIRYDEQARIHVEARELRSGKSARTTIERAGMKPSVTTPPAGDDDLDGLELLGDLSRAGAAAPLSAGTRRSAPPAPPARPNSLFAPSTAPRATAPPPAVQRDGAAGRPVAPVPPASAPVRPAQPQPRATAGPAVPPVPAAAPARKPAVKSPGPPAVRSGVPLESAERPIPLCNHCGEPLDLRGICPACRPGAQAGMQKRAATPPPAAIKKPRKPSNGG
jgi:molecular chaperone DnaK